jgi:hypothetical protein
MEKYNRCMLQRDLLDQRRKLHNSEGHYFHHIEVMSDKQELLI